MFMGKIATKFIAFCKGKSQQKKPEDKPRYDFKYKALESFVKATSGKEARNTAAI